MKKEYKEIELIVSTVQYDVLLESGDFVDSDIYDDDYQEEWTDFH